MDHFLSTADEGTLFGEPTAVDTAERPAVDGSVIGEAAAIPTTAIPTFLNGNAMGYG